MPTFIVMLNWTDQAIRAVKEAPKRIQAARKRCEARGRDQGAISHFR